MTNCEKATGRLTSDDQPDVVSQCFGVQPSTIFCLWHQSQTMEQPGMPVGNTLVVEEKKYQYKCAGIFFMIETYVKIT